MRAERENQENGAMLSNGIKSLGDCDSEQLGDLEIFGRFFLY